jgi:PAS domain S-box-containing protein
VFGYAPEDVRGQNISRYLSEARRSAIQEALERLRAGRAVTGEVDVYRADGRRIITSYSIASLDDDEGRPIGFVGTLLDVTEGRRAAEAHRISEARLHAVIDNAPAAITIRGADGRLLVANREAARLLGGEPGALPGTVYEDFHDEEQAAALRELDARVLGAGGPVVSQTTMQRPDGEHIFFTAVFPLPAGRGEGPLVCHMMFDVTDRERARRELERSHEERRRLLAELVRAQEDERRRIAADVHDESIQVLAGVAIRLGMLSGMLDQPEQRRLIEGLDDSVRRGIKSLRQLLFDLRLPALDELGLAAALRSYLSETIAPEGVAYALEDRLGGAEPPAELRTVLYRVAQEALSNIRKHAHAHHVEVTLAGSAEHVEVTVRDDGVGFATSNGGEVPGHLGLVGMRERIGAAGGWIEVESEPGRGTEVRFGVPLAAAAPAAPAALSGAR